MKRFDVVALGELLVDFTMNGTSVQGNPLFEANPGGAPCNVLAMLQRLGRQTAFLGKVGKDSFGGMLKKTVQEQGIDISGLVMDDKVPTTLAFVHTAPDGDRNFSFYRSPGADMMLKEEELKTDMLSECEIFHFGTLSMTHDEVRRATKKAIALAKENGALISFDPNLRPPLWSSLDLAKEQVAYGLGQCDVLKISDNEIQWFTGKEDYDEGIAVLQETYHIPLILLSLGREGSRAYYQDIRVEKPGFTVKAIETTGAGDTFCGCAINGLLKYGLDGLTEETLGELLTYANAGAALITLKKGAIRSMPEPSQIEEMVK